MLYACVLSKKKEKKPHLRDTQVSEVPQMDEASMRTEWFGGEYSQNVWDPQMRWYDTAL